MCCVHSRVCCDSIRFNRIFRVARFDSYSLSMSCTRCTVCSGLDRIIMTTWLLRRLDCLNTNDAIEIERMPTELLMLFMWMNQPDRNIRELEKTKTGFCCFFVRVVITFYMLIPRFSNQFRVNLMSNRSLSRYRFCKQKMHF